MGSSDRSSGLNCLEWLNKQDMPTVDSTNVPQEKCVYLSVYVSMFLSKQAGELVICLG